MFLQLCVAVLVVQDAAAMMEKDYFSVLGLDSDATESEVRLKYKQLAVIYHPDKNSDPDASQRFQEILEAFQILTERIRRAEEEEKRAKTGQRDVHWAQRLADDFAEFKRRLSDPELAEDMLARMAPTVDRDTGNVVGGYYMMLDDIVGKQDQDQHSAEGPTNPSKARGAGLTCKTFTTVENGSVSKYTRCR